MRRLRARHLARSLLVALLGMALATPVLAADVVLQPDVKGCNGVLPSTDGNTDMLLVGGTLTPGGTAVFEITYPLDASDIGKQFTILACAFINDVAELKYIVSFVPSNETFRLRMTFAIPDDAPVGGTYCNYTKTTRSPTAPQASQRKAGPTCFIIRPPTTVQPPRDPTDDGSTPPPPPPPRPGDPSTPDTDTPGTGTPGINLPLLPNTAMPSPNG